MSQDSQGRYVTPDESPAGAQLASAARTTSTTGTAFDTSGVSSINASLVVTAVTGTNPTLDVVLETAGDGVNFDTVAAWAQKTAAAAADSQLFGPLGPLSRWKWTIGGTATPTFTFAITATTSPD